MKRSGSKSTGGSLLSGDWITDKVENVSENGRTFMLEATAAGLKMTAPTGEGFDAQFDGKDYPMTGVPGNSTVSLKRIDRNTIEETDKRDGKVISTARMTVAGGGRTMTMVLRDKDGAQQTFMFEKQ